MMIAHALRSPISFLSVTRSGMLESRLSSLSFMMLLWASVLFLSTPSISVTARTESWASSLQLALEDWKAVKRPRRRRIARCPGRMLTSARGMTDSHTLNMFCHFTKPSVVVYGISTHIKKEFIHSSTISHWPTFFLKRGAAIPQTDTLLNIVYAMFTSLKTTSWKESGSGWSPHPQRFPQAPIHPERIPVWNLRSQVVNLWLQLFSACRIKEASFQLISLRKAVESELLCSPAGRLKLCQQCATLKRGSRAENQ